MIPTSSDRSATLTSPVAPHYFAGQLLSDGDLDILVEWARARLELGGRRDGYGIVFGIPLRVDARPGHEDEIAVGAGFAVGPFGEDIVVPTEMRLSLSTVSLPDDGDPRKRHPVDLFLEAEQVRERPQPGFDIGPETYDPGSTYSRVCEGFKLTAEAVTEEEDPASLAASAFEEGYDKCLEPLEDFRSWKAAATRKPEEIRNWLRRRLMETEFRLVAYELDQLNNDELRDERVQVRALYWLIQHRRNAYLAAFATSETRVRLGRAWVLARTKTSPPTAVAIDDRPPYRRRLAELELPARRGSVNVGSVIWEREPVAKLMLARAGIMTGEPRVLRLPHRLNGLRDALRGRLWLDPGQRAVLLVYEYWPFGRRVVGVLAEDEPEETPVDQDEERREEATEKERVIEESKVEEGTVDENGVEGVDVEETPTEPDPEPEPPRPKVVGIAVILQPSSGPSQVDLVEGEEIAIGRKGARIETVDDHEDKFLDEFGRHGVIRVRDEEVVFEVTSALGVKVSGRKLRGKKVLSDGDTIEVGQTVVRVQLGGS